MKKTLEYVFLIPIATSYPAKLVPVLLNLSKYSAYRDKTHILTVANRLVEDARNYLATAGGGYINSVQLVEQVDYMIWIDSDIYFTIKDLEYLMNYEDDFCTGWYIKDNGGRIQQDAMVGYFDEDFFMKNKYFPFLQASDLDDMSKKGVKAKEVDYCGFGFTKIKADLFKEIEYPYFRHNIMKIGDFIDNSSEDVSFCKNLYDATGVKPKVITDLRVGHLKEIYI